MSVTHTVVTAGIKACLHIVCRIDAEQMERIPRQGPLILVANHINSLEVPIVYTHLHPRPATAFAKAETWDQPLNGRLARLWGAIPLHRGEADAEAFRSALEALRAGKILALAPEGTRSHNGELQRGLPGAVLLAERSGAPLMPMALFGHETYLENLRKLRRTDFHVVVGEPIVIDLGGRRAGQALRQAVADELMARIAALLPPRYRGVYADAVGQPLVLTRPCRPGECPGS
jgi:1-acyl-sn-glycerol-3-phosphate acyltransferase